MKNGLKRVLATALTLLIMMQCAPLNAFAAGLGNEVATFASTDTAITLQNGSAVIPSGADEATVKQILVDTLISNKDEVDTSSVEWQYFCTGKTSTGLKSKDAWVPISGTTIRESIYTYTFPALANNDDGKYQVRIADITDAVTLTKVAKLDGSITVNEGCSVAIPHNEDGSVNYAELYQKLIKTVVASTTPVLTREQLTIAYEATATTGVVKNYMPLEGGTKNLLTYPAISAGNQKIKFSWNGNADYYGFEKEVAVTLTERRTTNLVLKADQNVTLTYKDGTVDYSTLKNAIFDAVFDESSTPNNLKAADVTIEWE